MKLCHRTLPRRVKLLCRWKQWNYEHHIEGIIEIQFDCYLPFDVYVVRSYLMNHRFHQFLSIEEAINFKICIPSMQHMAGSTVFLGTSLLPANLTSLQDAEFYHFVKRIVGPVEAELLQVQQINNVNSLLMTADVFEIIQIPSQDLDDIKRKICFEKDDGSFVIKAGVKGNIDYLIELLRAKNNADKRSKNLRATLTSPSTGLPNAGNTSIPVCSNATATNAVPSLTLSWTLTDHEKFITDSIQRWCDDNKENFKLLGTSPSHRRTSSRTRSVQYIAYDHVDDAMFSSLSLSLFS